MSRFAVLDMFLLLLFSSIARKTHTPLTFGSLSGIRILADQHYQVTVGGDTHSATDGVFVDKVLGLKVIQGL